MVALIAVTLVAFMVFCVAWDAMKDANENRRLIAHFNETLKTGKFMEEEN